MIRHLGRIATAALFMTAYCPAITWDGRFEFDSPGDYDPLTDTCYTQAGHPALPAEGTSGTANLVLPPDSAPEDGYLRIVTTGGRRAYRLVDAPGFSHNAGWTVEYRIRFDRSHDYRGTETAWQLQIRDDVRRHHSSVGSPNGPDIARLDAEIGDASVSSWTPEAGGTLIETASEWHVYRMLYDPAFNRTELWVDGTLVIAATFTNAGGGPQLTWGVTRSAAASVEVWVDYIRWAVDEVERPGGPGLDRPALRNRFFDNIVPYQPGPPAILAVPAFWEIQNITGPGVVATAETGIGRCESYGKALRLAHSQAYDAVVKQVVDLAGGATVEFKANLRAQSAACTPLWGRVGVHPTGDTNPLSPDVLWSDWAVLADESCLPIPCADVGVTAASPGPAICVFIEVRAALSSPAEQVAFIDNARLVITPSCGTPPQDADRDGDVDVNDFAIFQACFNGAGKPYPETLPPAARQRCRCLDEDEDADVDVGDFAVFQACFNGAGKPPPAGCR